MRSLGTRRVALFTGAVTVAAVALTGCSAGQVAGTSLNVPSNQGVNTATETGSVLIRNLSVGYNGTAGYQPGTDAPIEVNLYNRTNSEITVRVSSGAPDPGAPATGVVTATQIGLKGSSTGTASSPGTASSTGTASSPGTAPSPSAAESAAPAAQPAELTISPMGNVTFRPGDSQTLEAIGLNGKLQPGGQLSLVFEFSDGSPTLKVLAPIASPLTPAPRASGNPNENAEE